MVKMAAIAPKGVFEDEEVMTVSYREEPYERHYDDFPATGKRRPDAAHGAGAHGQPCKTQNSPMAAFGLCHGAFAWQGFPR